MDSFNHLSIGVFRCKIVHFIDYAVIQFNANTSHIWKLYHVRQNEEEKKRKEIRTKLGSTIVARRNSIW